MTARECIIGRRSIRRFEETPVSHELLEQIIETASFAPSWKNTQVTRYIAVEGETKAKLATLSTIWPNNGAIMESAPMVIAVTVVTGRSGFERDGSFSTGKGDSWQMYDAGIASQTLCLAAHEQGLGTVIMGLYDEADVTALLEIPDTQELVALIAIGYPAQSPDAPKRKEVTDLLSYKS